MSNPNAITCFTETEGQRITQTVDHLLPHLAPNEYAFVGGLAIRCFVAMSGQPYPLRDFNDLDIVVKRRRSVEPSITEDFKISHFHDTERGPYWEIVDPETKIKVDMFPWPPCEPTIIDMACGDRTLPFQSPEDQLAKTIFDTTKILRGEVVDPKQLYDAELLTHIAEPEKTLRIFTTLYGDLFPSVKTAREALALAQQAKTEHPELVRKKPFHKPLPYECSECSIDADYPLTPLANIHDLLGYIE